MEFFNLTPIKFYKKILSLFRKFPFHVIFSRDDLSLLLLGILFKLRYKIPLIFQFTIPIKYITEKNHEWYHPRNIGGAIKHILLLKCMKFADLVLPISYWMGAYLFHNGIDKDKIYPFPDGANIQLFKPNHYPKADKAPTFVYIGAIARIRRLEVLINAMEKFCKNYSNAKLFMVGYGNDVNRLKRLAKEKQLDKNIIFTGNVDYEVVPHYINKAHIALCPIPPFFHYKLSSPLKLYEYMSCGRPVIANKEIPAHRKTINESKCGKLVNFNKDAFVDSMVALYENYNEAKKMGKAGRAWIEKNRTYAILADQLDKEFQKRFFKSNK
jgi:glycosyltransferase involved in cell wall biosynthesis